MINKGDIRGFRNRREVEYESEKERIRLRKIFGDPNKVKLMKWDRRVDVKPLSVDKEKAYNKAVDVLMRGEFENAPPKDIIKKKNKRKSRKKRENYTDIKSHV